MNQEIYKKLGSKEAGVIVNRLNPLFDGTQFSEKETIILAQNLSFYPGFRLLEISNQSLTPEIKRFVVTNDERDLVLNFSNESIYEFNQSLPITLNENNAQDYLRFFFNFVRGRYGRFLIVENVDAIAWKDDPPPAARKAVGELISPVELEKVDEKGTYHLRVCMIFKDSLFRSLVKIQPNGFVSIHDEELLVEDMPVLDDTLGQ
ncbi:MAG: hypothetical protein KTR28_05060 [Micavibrio sp.]|nr:hypothetical protein [Micavibrio sp.]